MSTCHNNRHNNSNKSSTTKINKHTVSGYSLFDARNFPFDATKNKLDCYRGKDCMEKFYFDLRKHTSKINYYEKKEKKEMIPLTNEEKKSNKSYVLYAKQDLVLTTIIIKNITSSDIIIITQKI